MAPIFVTCGNCSTRTTKVQHTVAEVRACFNERYYEEEQARQEANAEMGYEHYLERKIDDGFDEWEARRGVIDFSDAWDLADPSRLTYRDYYLKEVGV